MGILAPPLRVPVPQKLKKQRSQCPQTMQRRGHGKKSHFLLLCCFYTLEDTVPIRWYWPVTPASVLWGLGAVWGLPALGMRPHSSLPSPARSSRFSIEPGNLDCPGVASSF